MPSRLSQIAERIYGIAITDRSRYYVKPTAVDEGWAYKGVLALGEYDFKYIGGITGGAKVYKSNDYGSTTAYVALVYTDGIRIYKTNNQGATVYHICRSTDNGDTWSYIAVGDSYYSRR